jgi:uncharacterized protein YukE
MASGEGYQANAAELARQAQHFPDLANRAQGVHQSLSQALDSAGECWGADAAGQSFAASYLRPAREALDGLGSLAGRLTEVGDRWSATASGYQQVETSNARAFHAMDK